MTIIDKEDILFEGNLNRKSNFLDALQEKNIYIPFSCHQGACGCCAVKVLKGMEYIDQERFGEKYIETDKNIILTCLAGLKKDANYSKAKMITLETTTQI